jgi:hypothetical protein
MAINTIHKNLFKLILKIVKDNLRQVIFILCMLMLYVSGCVSKTEYLSYEDKKGKGAEQFIKDLKFCQIYSNQNAKQIEGSKGAGERYLYENSIFILCMKNKNWVLKE